MARKLKVKPKVKKQAFPSDATMVRAAKRLFDDEGTIEVDEGAKVSRADGNLSNGAYVEGWVWIYDDDVSDEDKK